MTAISENQSVHQALDSVVAARNAGRRGLTEAEAKRLLATLGIGVPSFEVVDSGEAAATAAASLGFPVAIKVASPDILHKSDVGGVILNVASRDQARTAFEQVLQSAREARPDADVRQAIVETMCPPDGTELIVGVVRDPLFGPVAMVGLGGIFVEVLRDVAFRPAPISGHDAREMLAQLRGARILDGVRGRQPVDRDAIVDLLLTVAGDQGLVARTGEAIAELDLNPVFAYPSGVTVADARTVLADEPAAAPASIGALELRETMRAVFAPRSIAVVGASTEEMKLGYRALKNLVDFGYSGALYPIHPRAQQIYGRQAYPRLADVPGPVERAIVTLPIATIPDVISQCVEKGVQVVHIYTAGFGEVSAAGRQVERELLARVAGSGLRIIGPNCIGTYAPSGGLSPIPGVAREAGPVAFVSQSGGLTYDTIRRGGYQGLRFSKVISIGNAIDLDPTDFLEYYADDPDTRIVGAYVESVHDGRRLRRVLERATRQKPVVVLKGGQTTSGQRAAASHTGALASDFAIWQGLFEQTGVSTVQTIEEMIDVLLAFQMLTPPAGPGVALIGPGGGASVTATDAADRQGLVVAPFAAETVAALEALQLPPGTSLVNPLDVPAPVLSIQEGAVLGRILQSAAADPGIAALIVHLNLVPILALASIEVTAGFVRNMVAAVASLRRSTDRPLCLVLRSSGEPEQEDVVRDERQRALAAGIPVYPGIEEALRALGHVYRYGRFTRRPSV